MMETEIIKQAYVVQKHCETSIKTESDRDTKQNIKGTIKCANRNKKFHWM